MKSVSALLLCLVPTLPLVVAAGDAAPVTSEADDVVVVAVVDGGFDPYHLDWVAEEMPQHLDGDPANDLPLGTGPDQWLPGFPDPTTFAGYERLDLTLPLFGDEARAGLDAEDRAQWERIETSTDDATHYYWVPGSKVIGMVDFDEHDVHQGGAAHGSGTSSVAVGNLHGTCPECVVVFVDYGTPDTAEAAINWVLDQPWIDVVTNSYGFSTVSRDRIYRGSDTGRQRLASERGQTVLFSAGNGQANAFLVPNTTLHSSQEGPDWIITVGAVSPEGASYTGHGKPADVASLGTDYPSSYCATTVDCEGEFSGTSNATPVVAGMYAKALREARLALAGPSRVQHDGVVARGAAVDCGAERPDCELGDGELTAVELRRRLFHGAVHSEAGWFVGALGVGSGSPRTGWEHEFLNEGHGSYVGRFDGDDAWHDEVARIVAPMLGDAATLERPAGEDDWFVVDSWCRQQLWGEWDDGDWLRGFTVLPPRDPAWPVRTAMLDGCLTLPGGDAG